MAEFQFVALRKEIDHDRDYKVPHVSVAFTVAGWKNSWNGYCTEYMDISGILSEEKANLILAAPELLEALRPFALVYEKDISVNEDDADLFQVMHAHNLAPKLTVGDFRKAYNALLSAEGRP